MSVMRYLSEHDVVAILDMPRAIDALAETLTAQGHGQARNLPKTLATWDNNGSMHALGSVMLGASGVCGFKTWVHAKKGGGSVFTLFDVETGRLMAVIEARALGMLRTAAMSGLATRAMAPPDACTVALIGTGPQAVTQLAALAAVRPLKRVRVYSPTPEKRAAFVQRLAPRYDFTLEVATSIPQALEGAEIVTLVTRAEAPFVDATLLRDCRHLNAVGAILPTRAEFAQDVFDLAHAVVVDDLENIRRGSRELRERYGDDDQAWSNVKTLSQWLVQDPPPAPATGLRLFKSMGMGLSDLALARVVIAEAETRGLGRALPPQTRENLL